MTTYNKTELTAQILENAADVLERDGWCRGVLHAGTGKPGATEHYALGAVETAFKEIIPSKMNHPRRVDVHREARNMLRAEIEEWCAKHNNGHYPSIATWNDEIVKERRTVVRALRRAAARARKTVKN